MPLGAVARGDWGKTYLHEKSHRQPMAIFVEMGGIILTAGWKYADLIPHILYKSVEFIPQFGSLQGISQQRIFPILQAG